jgi:hypothetical protein
MTSTKTDRKPGDVVYSAHVSLNMDGELTLLVTRDVHAGICGPCSSELPTASKTLPQLDADLRMLGFVVAGPWKTVQAYDGLRLEVEVTR